MYGESVLKLQVLRFLSCVIEDFGLPCHWLSGFLCCEGTGTICKVLQGHLVRPESSFKMKVAVSVILLVMQRNCSSLTVTKLMKS